MINRASAKRTKPKAGGKMNESENLWTEEEIAELVARVLNEMGFSANSYDTGGGISCVVLQRKGGGEIFWRTADVNWGAQIVDADGETTSSIKTQCPSDTQDISKIVAAIKGPSIEAGAVA
jgi:hypothetical protein